MKSVSDFEDMLAALNNHQVRYLIIGGLAFIYHAKPRYTKDMDIWVESNVNNVAAANKALADFGSPMLLDACQPNEVLQLGIAPDRIDFFLRIEGIDFEEAWKGRILSNYGAVETNWISLEALLAIKSNINKPKHQEDARVLREVLKRRK